MAIGATSLRSAEQSFGEGGHADVDIRTIRIYHFLL
jgi:hypothetical protein